METLHTQIPAGYRRLKTNETFRAGDLFYSKYNPAHIMTVSGWASGTSIKSYNDLYNTSYVFFRQRVKPTNFDNLILVPKTMDKVIKIDVNKMIRDNCSSNTPKTDKVVMVKFQYPDSRNFLLRQRDVQLISIDDHYVIGLEYSPCKENGKRWKFKKYLRRRIPNGDVVVTHYGKPYLS